MRGDRSLRIGFMAGRFPATSETFVLNQVTGLIDRGHEVYPVSLCPPLQNQPRHDDVKQYSLEERTTVLSGYSRWGRLALTPLTALRVLGLRPQAVPRALNPARYGRAALSGRLLERAYHMERAGIGPLIDCMVCHFGPVGAEAVALREIGAFEAPIATFFHAYDLTRESLRKPGVYRRLFDEGELFFAISEYAGRLLTDLGCPDERIRIHHMGVDCDRFAYRERVHDGGPMRVLSVGWMVEKKGHMIGLRAVAAAREAGVSVEYTIAGDGPLRPLIEAEIARLGLGSHVRLAGWQTQDAVVELMYEHDILMMPSLTASSGDEEGVPVVLMEAMATGMPVLATQHAGIPELVDQGRTGTLVPEGDRTLLGEALVNLASDVGSWPSMSRAAREKIEAEFDIDVLNDRLEETLLALVQ